MALALVVLLTIAGGAAAGRESLESTNSSALAENLRQARGQTIGLELKSGESLIRQELLKVNVDRKKGTIISLRVQDTAGGEATTIRFTAIRAISVGREKFYEAVDEAENKGVGKAAPKRTAQTLEKPDQWVERAKKRGVQPWPSLSNQEHEATVEKQMQMVEELGRAMPGMALHETHEFLFYTNIPANQVAPYTSALDAMHDMMCQMYGIKRGEPVWKGKCLVVAFLNKAEFIRFEQTFMQNRNDISTLYGICHGLPDGRVIICCYRGDRPQDFAKMLVHETSHGFIYRYRTPVRPPSWVNEGMADWIGGTLVPQSKSVPQREQKALQTMRQTRSMGGNFLAGSGNLTTWQYGVASSLTDFMLRTDASAYTRFIQGIKEGLSWEESLAAAFACTPQELVASYGAAIGVPDLRP